MIKFAAWNIRGLNALTKQKEGCQFTWTQKPSGGDGIMRKLDRILGNSAFIARFGDASVFFEPRGISDHSPRILSFKFGRRLRHRGFKFDNFVTSHVDFLKSVEGVWMKPQRGSYMKRVLRKMHEMKGVCRRLQNSYGCLDKKVAQLKTELDVAQLACDLDSFNDLLKEDIAHLLLAYQKARNDQVEMVRQKAKISWLNEGDGNSKFFFHATKEKRNRSHIATIRDSFGTVFEHHDVPKAFINHFEGILGNSNMLDALFDIGNDKAPGLDGFSSKFFKAAWSVVGRDVLIGIHNFFYSANLDYQLNHTLLCLVPKVPNASCVTDYRPIACCNVLLKCISKIIAERIKGSLDFLISNAQSAFIPGHQMTDNILLARELIAGYQKSEGEPKCEFKIDIQKAYDTVDWQFLLEMLKGMGFHPVMINWIKSLISSPTFSICVNGR
ncbi:uncharacterized protein LOC112502414 [Cynara cardunculus var. scolymus]|uniref:uncharacterized protein LOC112502414 n=1 Tax=Cynara cardunculus var. scolymus TaxID=59895 RepID=UPI000D6251BA|nr:uncharacterized protein LOC112502414 [Cynara cardunculus var. scolymus]